jgi:hypothetical protein
MDRFWMWLAWKLPRRLAYWATVRVGADASFKLPHQDVSSITIMSALQRWS